MPLDPKAKQLLDRMALEPPLPALEQLPAPEVRQLLEGRLVALDSPPEPIARVEDREIPGPAGAIRVRVYTPEGRGPFPALVYFHGGGWVVCNLNTHEGPCRAVANAGRCVVVAVDYRLAPEHKFPAAVEDCYAATRWVAENAASIGVDPARIAAGGDSAGGNLATVVSLMARERSVPRLALQVLVYPVTNYDYTTRSYEENASGYFLTKDLMVYFWNQYLAKEADAAHPYASPLREPDLRGLPPALVITAEYDPLRDEGLAYAARLREAGVLVKLSHYEGMIHPFFSLGGVLDQAKQAREEVGRACSLRAGSHAGFEPAVMPASAAFPRDKPT